VFVRESAHAWAAGVS